MQDLRHHDVFFWGSTRSHNKLGLACSLFIMHHHAFTSISIFYFRSLKIDTAATFPLFRFDVGGFNHNMQSVTTAWVVYVTLEGVGGMQHIRGCVV